MERNAFFWQIQEGKLAPPKATQTLDINIVSFDGDAGLITVEFEGIEEFTNPAGEIQGGFLAAMPDDTMGAALAATPKAGEFAPTLDLQVQFLSPAAPGKLRGSGRMVQRRGRICFLAAELTHEGRIVATASATAFIRKL